MSSLTTKKAIAYTFKDLLKEKPFNKITINDIAKKCDINRQTFYYHFKDIRDLVEWICIEEVDNILSRKNEYDQWEDKFLSIFELMEKEKKFITNFYKYAFVSIVLDWIENNMEDDPNLIVFKVSNLITGTIEHACIAFNR